MDPRLIDIQDNPYQSKYNDTQLSEDGQDSDVIEGDASQDQNVDVNSA